MPPTLTDAQKQEALNLGKQGLTPYYNPTLNAVQGIQDPAINQQTIKGWFPISLSPDSFGSTSSPSGIVSSYQPLQNVQLGQAQGAAAGALGGAQPGSLSWYAQQIAGQQQTGITSAQELFKAGEATRKIEFDLAKAQSNFTYGQAIKDLQMAHSNAVEAASANAAALNPYSAAKGAQTAANFTDKIHQIYQGKEADLQAQSDLAQRAIEVNDQKAFNQAQQNLTSLIQDANKQAFNALLQIQSEARQANQFSLTYGLQKDTLENTKVNTATDNFRQYLTAFSGDPTILGQVEKYFSTGEIAPGLQPLIDSGVAAGMTPTEALSVLQYQTNAARNTALAGDRVSLAQANYYNKLSSQIPVAGQIVSTSGEVPVKLTDTQSQFFSMGMHLDSQAEKVRKLLSELPTGAVKGWVTEQGKFIPVVQNKNDPKQYQLLQAMADLNNTFVYFSTGKQLNETEFNRLANQLPNVKATPEYNASALQNFTVSIQDRMDSYLAVNGWKIYGASNKVPSTTDLTAGAKSILDKYGIQTK